MAPELYMRANNSNTKVDMWSLGVIVYKMLFDNRYPYLDPTVEYDINKIFRDIRANNLHIPSKPKRSDQIIKLC
jgi:serine/threonine protein kinase